MSISTLAELETAVATWLHRSDLSSSVDDIIMLGEKRIFREVRNRDMETALSVVIASGVATLPSDYVALKYAYIDGSPVQPLKRRNAQWVIENYPTRSSSDKPLFIASDNGSFIFGPYPDSGYTVKGVYYKRLTSIISGTNTLFTNNPDLYLAAALAEAASFSVADKKLAIWEPKYQTILALVNDEERDERMSGGGMSVSVG